MESRCDLAYDHILEEILSDRLVPGDLLIRREVAKRLGLSISPVGEAMLQLELEGILETVPRKGTRVRQPSQQEVWGLLMTRIAIECQVARMVCGERITESPRAYAPRCRN
ncbi:MAG: GntR family transcriptional regulator [Planctomycetes bacterium]|nr:GntR family transcriptional regulator [Planctomycetota bacterium]